MATPKVEAHGTLFRIEGDTLRFADGSCRKATGPEKAMWKKLMEQPADGVRGTLKEQP